MSDGVSKRTSYRDNTSTIMSALENMSSTVPYDHSHGGFAPRNHPRNAYGKGTGESAKSRIAKPLSQKAMLSRALQKANTAVQLDNAHNFDGAREAYTEACDLLRHVLQKTSANEDQRKLEAIRQTYTSRIDELNQIMPSQAIETKALPARPRSGESHAPTVLPRSQEAVFQDGSTADITPIGLDSAPSKTSTTLAKPSQGLVHGAQPFAGAATRQPQGQLELLGVYSQQEPVSDTARPPQSPGFLQSSFSKATVSMRSPADKLIRRPSDSQYMPSPLLPTRSYTPRDEVAGSVAPTKTDGALPAILNAEQAPPARHIRSTSQSSWLYPIDEAGRSSSPSIHSRTSSLGYRKRHIRSTSGDTEAEFDHALDAAIEAAYDDSYESMHAPSKPIEDDTDDVVAAALRKVELARERVRQTEREAQEMEAERRRLRELYSRPQPEDLTDQPGFFEDDSSENEEQILFEMTKGFAMKDMTVQPSTKPQQATQSRSKIPRESDSSGVTTRTWHSSSGSNPATGQSSLSTVAEPTTLSPSTHIGHHTAQPKPHEYPELPHSQPISMNQSVRDRRLSGQKAAELKIHTVSTVTPDMSRQPGSLLPKKSAQSDTNAHGAPAENLGQGLTAVRDPSSPSLGFDVIQPRYRGALAQAAVRVETGDGVASGADVSHVASSPGSKPRKNISSTSLRSMKNRNASLTNLDDGSEWSPDTPFLPSGPGLLPPAVPTLPIPHAAALRERFDGSAAGFHLFDDEFHSPHTPGTPNASSIDAPAALEPCPADVTLRPFWLMRCIYQTLVHPRGGYLSTKLFVPREVWSVKAGKLKNIDEKIANCDLLTAALMKLATADNYHADAVLDEMQALEGVMEQVQAALTRKLGNEVGVSSTATLFKEASGVTDGDTAVNAARPAAPNNKSAFSWRRLRSKNSAVGLANSQQNRLAVIDGSKEGVTLSTLPMTTFPSSRSTKRDLALVQFNGPNANYMGSLARLFDAAQAVDQIARQIEDPGLRHADKTQVGLELCTRHAAEFFGFYICRFVLTDLAMLIDKYVKRGSEWVLA